MRYRDHADLMVLQLGHWQPILEPDLKVVEQYQEIMVHRF